ncbi:hypothetical protein MKY84_05420 [Chryseomicrobium sp. FSL W7-1435]|uniref:hypothetical protein n=1 Tax=Chryseomicrobium sp. FSL W7-1435 TaxID=2921704 RepID=UPI00315A6E01
MNSHELKEWMATHEIVNRTVSGFWNYLYTQKNEDPADFETSYPSMEITLLEPTLSTVSHTLNFNYGDTLEMVTCSLHIEYQGKKIGMYESLYTPFGEDLDDFLTLSQPN